MALKLNLKPGEKIVINGAVIVNGDRKSSLAVKNFAQILRESDVMREADANTPVKRTYFAAQLLLLDPDNVEEYKVQYGALMNDLRQVFRNKDVVALLDECDEALQSGDYYKILAALRKVVRYEELLLVHAKAQKGPEVID